MRAIRDATVEAKLNNASSLIIFYVGHGHSYEGAWVAYHTKE